jgi:2,4-dienoyl-CoA reductase-like NADH-dependent reductase (Old Yellow Enzyme family)
MTSPFDQLGLLHGATLPNRFMLAPLTNQQSNPDGTLSDDEFHWLTMRATGGFGLVTTCAAHVQAVGQGFAGQLGIFDDAHLAGLERLADAIATAGAVGIVQLHHAGIRAVADLIGGAPVGPSDDPDTGARALTNDEVRRTIDDFVAAAVRAKRAGFGGVELHGAHGYLICAFLSAELNRRNDEYGGVLENRARFLMEIVHGVRAECGSDFVVAVRLSPERFGMQLAEVEQVYAWLVQSGDVDLIDMSLWDVHRVPNIAGYEGRTLLDIVCAWPRGEVRLGVAGKIHEPNDVNAVLDAGADVAVIGRAAILHHDYPQRMRADAAWIPVRPPVTMAHLSSEGVSPTFGGYLRDMFKFVAD